MHRAGGDPSHLVTARLPCDELYRDLVAQREVWGRAGVESVTAVGDALAPSTIAAAVWQGRRCAEELDAGPPGGRRR